MAVALYISGEHNDLPFFADTFAGSSYARFLLQNQVQDAAFARCHGIESEWGMRFADTVSGNASGKF